MGPIEQHQPCFGVRVVFFFGKAKAVGAQHSDSKKLRMVSQQFHKCHNSHTNQLMFFLGEDSWGPSPECFLATIAYNHLFEPQNSCFEACSSMNLLWTFQPTFEKCLGVDILKVPKEVEMAFRSRAVQPKALAAYIDINDDYITEPEKVLGAFIVLRRSFGAHTGLPK